MISIFSLLIIIESAKKHYKNEFRDLRNPRQKLVCFAFIRDDVNNVNTVRRSSETKKYKGRSHPPAVRSSELWRLQDDKARCHLEPAKSSRRGTTRAEGRERKKVKQRKTS